MDSGLEGVIAADTVLSHVDGRKGTIVVRGHSIGDLVKNHDFEARSRSCGMASRAKD